jgi:DNA-binding transcriptional MerR regulator
MFDPIEVRCSCGLPLEVKQVAKLLGVKPRTVRWYVATKRLAERRRGKKILVFVLGEVLEFKRVRDCEKEAA